MSTGFINTVSSVIYDNYSYVIAPDTPLPSSPILYPGYQYWGPSSGVTINVYPSTTSGSTITMGPSGVSFTVAANSSIIYTYTYNVNLYVLYGSEIIINGVTSSHKIYLFLTFTNNNNQSYYTSYVSITPSTTSVTIPINSSISGVLTSGDESALLSLALNIYNPHAVPVNLSFGSLTSQLATVPYAYIYDNLGGANITSTPTTSMSIYAGPYMYSFPSYLDINKKPLTTTSSTSLAYYTPSTKIQEAIGATKYYIVVPYGTLVTFEYFYTAKSDVTIPTGIFIPSGTIINVIFDPVSSIHMDSCNKYKNVHQSGIQGAIQIYFYISPDLTPLVTSSALIQGSQTSNGMQFVIPSTYYMVTKMYITISTGNLSCISEEIVITGITSTIPIDNAVYDNYNFKQPASGNVYQYYPSTNPTKYWYPPSQRSIELFDPALESSSGGSISRNVVIPGGTYVNGNNANIYTQGTTPNGNSTAIVAYHLHEGLNISYGSFLGVTVLGSTYNKQTFEGYSIGSIINDSKGYSYQSLYETNQKLSPAGYLFLIPIKGVVKNTTIVGYYIRVYGVGKGNAYTIIVGPLMSYINNSCTLLYDNFITPQKFIGSITSGAISGTEIPYQGYQSYIAPSTRNFLTTESATPFFINDVFQTSVSIVPTVTEGNYILQGQSTTSIGYSTLPFVFYTFPFFVRIFNKHPLRSNTAIIIYDYNRLHNDPLFNTSTLSIPEGSQIKLIGYTIVFYVPILKIITGSEGNYIYYYFPGAYDGSNTVFTITQNINNVSRIRLEITVSPGDIRTIFFLTTTSTLCNPTDTTLHSLTDTPNLLLKCNPLPATFPPRPPSKNIRNFEDTRSLKAPIKMITENIRKKFALPESSFTPMPSTSSCNKDINNTTDSMIKLRL